MEILDAASSECVTQMNFTFSSSSCQSMEYRHKASKLSPSLAVLLARLSLKYKVKDTEEVNS